jgi:ketosteroid isomerase-like protein
MSIENRISARRRWLTGTLVTLAVVFALEGPGTAGGSEARSGCGAAISTEDQMIAEARRQNQKLVHFFNDRKFEEIGALYTDDAILVAPNSEPVQGRSAIIEWFRNAREIYGEVELLPDTYRTSASGDLVSLVEKFSAYSGHVRATGHGLWKCQPDGTLKYAVDMFGMRDPTK